MEVKEVFFSSEDYASSIANYVRTYFQGNGYNLLTPAAYELALAEWIGGLEDVRKVYTNLYKRYASDYKKFTDLVMQVNMLSWANNTLIRQGFDGRGEYLEFYSELYYEARDSFYDTYSGNEEACDYYFNTTD